MKKKNIETLAYFLCSEKVIKSFPDCEHSKPFKSGFRNDDDNHYIALLDFNKTEKYYNELSEDEQDEFWCRECVQGTMDVSKITLTAMRKNGIFAEIEMKIGLTTTRNQAMTIRNLSEKFNCSPIELINKIVK